MALLARPAAYLAAFMAAACIVVAPTSSTSRPHGEFDPVPPGCKMVRDFQNGVKVWNLWCADANGYKQAALAYPDPPPPTSPIEQATVDPAFKAATARIVALDLLAQGKNPDETSLRVISIEPFSANSRDRDRKQVTVTMAATQQWDGKRITEQRTVEVRSGPPNCVLSFGRDGPACAFASGTRDEAVAEGRIAARSHLPEAQWQAVEALAQARRETGNLLSAADSACLVDATRRSSRTVKSGCAVIQNGVCMQDNTRTVEDASYRVENVCSRTITFQYQCGIRRFGIVSVAPHQSVHTDYGSACSWVYP